jgi:hypothetical protein
MAPQSKGGQQLLKKTIEHYKGWFLNTQKVPGRLLCCYESSKMICRTLGGAPKSF